MSDADFLLFRQRHELIRHWVDRLHVDYDAICFTYRIKLTRPWIRLDDSLKKWGEWDPIARSITLSTVLLEKHAWDIVLEIFKHEMAHQLVSEIYGSDAGHGPLFYRACEQLGVASWAARASVEEKGIPLGYADVLDNDETRLLRRAEKLLALANSSNEHEALAAMEKVQELYARHNLDRLDRARKSNYVHQVIRTGKKKVERFQSVAVSILNDHFFVEVIQSSEYDASRNEELKIFELMGTRENVQMAEYVYHFLMHQASGRWDRFRREEQLRSRLSRTSYLTGLMAGFREQLELAEKKVDRETQKALVRCQNDPELAEFVNFRHPRLRKIYRGARRGDGRSYEAGKKEGRELILSRALSSSDGNQNRRLTR